MPAKTVYNQDQIDFIKKIMRQKVRATHQANTPACNLLANQVNLSYATLLKALKGEFTLRTVRRMMQAGWFTNGEYINTQQNHYPGGANRTRTGNGNRRTRRRTNDQAQQKSREDAAFRRGFRQGRTEGYNQGKSQAPNNTQSYSRGYADGVRDGRQNARSAPSNGASGVPLDRLQSLLNMTVSRGATQGEVVAARRAVGKTLAKWIREKFGQNLDVQVS